MIAPMKKVIKKNIWTQDVKATHVLKNSRAVMINRTQFEYGLRRVKNLDKIKNNTDTLTDHLKIKPNARKKQKIIMKIIIQALLEKRNI